jgi:hypothetical protein
MKIEGTRNDDNTEIVLKVSFEGELEFRAFDYFFRNMIADMVKATGGIAIDPVNNIVIGDYEGDDDELIQEALKSEAMKVASSSNKELPLELRSKFIQ